MILRRAQRHELGQILDWAADEGWNPGLDDADAFWETDPRGFFVAEVGDQIVAAVSVVVHDTDHAFLGLYLCLPGWRGQGIGFALWQHALGHAENRAVGLDGVAAQQANYEKSGFRRKGATRRLEGCLQPVIDPTIRTANDSDFDQILSLDRVANGYGRQSFLTTWTRQTPTRRTVIFLDGTGYATIRKCRGFAKIGPIVAQDATLALRLARSAIAEIGEAQVAIDLPEASVHLGQVLSEAGFVNSFTTARMIRGNGFQAGPSLQAIGTMELG